ncbi:MAG: hypothetical protein JXB15_15995 [Anaerolineales bacterium]|nr:hypothetical protein [Anaerolineales bacterium]
MRLFVATFWANTVPPRPGAGFIPAAAPASTLPTPATTFAAASSLACATTLTVLFTKKSIEHIVS